MKKTKNNKLAYFIICITITSLLDINLSDLIAANYNYLNSGILSKALTITYYENTGAAFSIFQNSTQSLVIIGFLSSIILLWLILKNINKLKLIDCFLWAILISGIFCNTYERFSLGVVRDFFDITFLNFPIFNISDILINLSVLAIIIRVIKENKKNTND